MRRSGTLFLFLLLAVVPAVMVWTAAGIVLRIMFRGH